MTLHEIKSIILRKNFTITTIYDPRVKYTKTYVTSLDNDSQYYYEYLDNEDFLSKLILDFNRPNARDLAKELKKMVSKNERI